MSSLTSGVVHRNVQNYSCALTTGGGIKCWGRNQYGQPGNGSLVSTLFTVLTANTTATRRTSTR